MVPALFPALKEAVRINPAPGQFFLTGSVRFTSRKVIRESLTGRLIQWELLPMDIAEMCGDPLPHAIPKLFKARTVEVDLPPPRKLNAEDFSRYLEKGGLPGIFAVRSAAIRSQRFETQLETMLGRDLKLVSETTLEYRSIRDFVVFLANRQGHPIEYAEAARATRISVPTLRKLTTALEALFMIRVIPAEGGEKRPVIFLEDQGEATQLKTLAPTPLEDLERFLYANLRTQWIYRPELGIRLSQYRTRGGSYVPFVLRSKSGALGILPILEENPGPQAMGSASSFLKTVPGSKLIFVHPGTKDQILSTRQRALGMGRLL
jgi:predicted AAA+ superfamily ATPase